MEHKSLDNLMKFALSFASGNVYDLSTVEKYNKILSKNSNKNNNNPWLISYCLSTNEDDINQHDEEVNYELNCLDDVILRKIAIMLHGLVKVATINCNKKEARENLCPLLKPKLSAPCIFYPNSLPNITRQEDPMKSEKKYEIVTSQYKLIVEAVLSYLPDLSQIKDEAEFEIIMQILRDRSKSERPWLIQFIDGFTTQQDLELKKLPSLLKSDYNFAQFDCSKPNHLNICSRLQIVKYPTFVLFKSASFMFDSINLEMGQTNWYEIFYGSKTSPDSLASFVNENAHTQVRTLTQFDDVFMEQELKTQNRVAFFFDFFGPGS
jgi:hypothetical protein